MAVAGVAVHRLAAQAMATSQVVGGGDHVQARRRVVQCLPEKILELHRAAETKAIAVGVGRNRVARHRLTGHAQHQLGLVAQLFGGLAQQLETGGTDALYPQRRDRLRHTAVQTDMPGQQIRIEAGLGHGAGQHAVHRQGVDARAGQHFTADLDAQVDG